MIFRQTPIIKKRAILVPDSVINVAPEDGWGNYDTYITKSPAVSSDMCKKKIHGEVEDTFEVQRMVHLQM